MVERRTASLKVSAEAYLELRCEEEPEFEFKIVKAAARQVRDFVAWRGRGLSGLCNAEKFLDVMDIAFCGALSNGDYELKSQLVQCWSKEHAALGLEPMRDCGKWKSNTDYRKKPRK